MGRFGFYERQYEGNRFGFELISPDGSEVKGGSPDEVAVSTFRQGVDIPNPINRNVESPPSHFHGEGFTQYGCAGHLQDFIEEYQYLKDEREAIISESDGGSF